MERTLWPSQTVWEQPSRNVNMVATQHNACLRTRDKARGVRGEVRHETSYILCDSYAIHHRFRNHLRTLLD